MKQHNTGVMSGGRCFAFCLYRSRSFAQNANILRRSAVSHSATSLPEMLFAFLSARMRPLALRVTCSQKIDLEHLIRLLLCKIHLPLKGKAKSRLVCGHLRVEMVRRQKIDLEHLIRLLLCKIHLPLEGKAMGWAICR